MLESPRREILSLAEARVIFSEPDGPYFHLGCLIVGGLIILSLKNRYPRLYLSEAIGSFFRFVRFEWISFLIE